MPMFTAERVLWVLMVLATLIVVAVAVCAVVTVHAVAMVGAFIVDVMYGGAPWLS